MEEKDNQNNWKRSQSTNWLASLSLLRFFRNTSLRTIRAVYRILSLSSSHLDKAFWGLVSVCLPSHWHELKTTVLERKSQLIRWLIGQDWVLSVYMRHLKKNLFQYPTQLPKSDPIQGSFIFRISSKNQLRSGMGPFSALIPRNCSNFGFVCINSVQSCANKACFICLCKRSLEWLIIAYALLIWAYFSMILKRNTTSDWSWVFLQTLIFGRIYS